MSEENIQQKPDQAVNPEENTDTQVETEKTFTQEQVTGIAAKEAKKAQENLLKELGVDDFDSAKEGLRKFKEYQESQKTEAQKKEEALKAKEEEANDYKSKYEATVAENSALKLGVHSDYLSDVITLANAKVSDEVSIDEAMKEVIEKYPHFTGELKEEKKPRPKFIVGGNPSVGENEPTDPFQEKLNKYKS